MKKQQSTITSTTFEVSKNFEKNVFKILKIKSKNIHIQDISFQWIGYGTYRLKMDVWIDLQIITIHETTHDSKNYDYYKSLEYHSRNYNNWMKNTALRLFENGKEKINETLILTED